MTSSSSPAVAVSKGIWLVSPERQSSSSAWPASQSSDADWSMIPHGTPAKSFSARCAAAASAGRVMSSWYRSASASATEHSSAADEDRPAPRGTSESITSRAPPAGCPASRRAQTTPAG